MSVAGLRWQPPGDDGEVVGWSGEDCDNGYVVEGGATLGVTMVTGWRWWMTNTQTPPPVPTVVNPTGAPVTNRVANHAERPEKFNGQNFKMWQQKMFFYLTTLGLARLLKETVPQVEPPAEDVSEFIEKRLTDVLFGKPFKECVRLEVDATEGILRFKIENDKTIFNMPRAFNKFSKLITEQHNKMAPVLRTSKEDKAREIYHPYQKIKEFYKECLHLGDEYKRYEEVIDWIKHGQASMYETT
nr:homeodomain-like protein [Tanacetum cinerariifolium]